MDVDVDVGDLAHLGLPQGGDGQRGVIVETETRGVGGGHRVTQAGTGV